MTGTLAERFAALGQALPAGSHLLAVSKGHPAELVRQLASLGQRSFGESRVQEAIAKQAELADLPPLDWHFIGRLQANKARQVLRHFGTIHSVDSLELAQRLARIAAEEGLSPRVFFQLKFQADPDKTGWEPDHFLRDWPQLQLLAPLQAVGLMTILPFGLTLAERKVLFDRCAAFGTRFGLPELSMGMSGDWPEAAAAGSTWLRIGSGLFGSRNNISA
ncbi:YggS family pyridoxal phosphate-dependent enzyme [Cyanobium sp. WAJ14-Wanaka]|uniref:YggS family pyridoxal phosphate-dependent enzyme n=1 Tax=Cyanobium sp. WAJ14-Wanaka TaxID=2823725 RepID=UPI0020CCE58B|nr:YggS family pyridoxal phosphate-dependent enzyme [Cyanobium sp. WAJ14-Wanaka]MCP9774002.1 YggS family pyridoxal phosphate-dependent enzyme [Cyanobium sp. WAJ14-Wanaka]